MKRLILITILMLALLSYSQDGELKFRGGRNVRPTSPTTPFYHDLKIQNLSTCDSLNIHLHTPYVLHFGHSRSRPQRIDIQGGNRKRVLVHEFNPERYEKTEMDNSDIDKLDDLIELNRDNNKSKGNDVVTLEWYIDGKYFREEFIAWYQPINYPQVDNYYFRKKEILRHQSDPEMNDRALKVRMNPDYIENIISYDIENIRKKNAISLWDIIQKYQKMKKIDTIHIK